MAFGACYTSFCRLWAGRGREIFVGKKPSIMKNATTTRFVVREPRNVEELEALLRLRYSVFRGHELRFLVRENEYGLDVDAWDKQAWHIGLYKQTKAECQPVGCMRFIHNGPERSDLVYELGKEYPALERIIAQKPPTTHPFLERYSRLLSPEMLIAFQTVAPGNLAEVSRFALLESDKDHITSRFMVESVTAIFHLYKKVDTVFEVAVHHAPFYQRYGYRPVAKRDYEELPWEAVLIHAHPSYMERKHQPRVRHMAEAFEEMQEIWLHTDDPENYRPSAKHLSELNEG